MIDKENTPSDIKTNFLIPTEIYENNKEGRKSKWDYRTVVNII